MPRRLANSPTNHSSSTSSREDTTSPTCTCTHTKTSNVKPKQSLMYQFNAICEALCCECHYRLRICIALSIQYACKAYCALHIDFLQPVILHVVSIVDRKPFGILPSWKKNWSLLSIQALKLKKAHFPKYLTFLDTLDSFYCKCFTSMGFMKIVKNNILLG